MIDILLKGGPLMIPLLLCSILTLAVLFDRGLAFMQNAKVDTRSLRARIRQMLAEDRVDDAARLCAATPGPVSAVLLTGLQAYAKHRDLHDRVESLTSIMEKAMDDYSLHAMSAVEKRLNVLATVASAAPLLGMTGTVTGMIKAFANLQEAGAGSDVVGLAISEALITTAAGLMIALVAVIPWNYFVARADHINLEIEEASSELVDFTTAHLATRRS